MEEDLTDLNQTARHELPRSKQYMRLDSQWETRIAGIVASATEDLRARITGQGEVFKTVLRHIWNKNHPGACHDSSAYMYVLLAELGCDPTLCIGEPAPINTKPMDHSWVEVDGLVFDAAISLPLDGLNSAFIGGPVFRSIELCKMLPTTTNYNHSTGFGFGRDAEMLYDLSLSEFALLQKTHMNTEPEDRIWNTAATLSAALGGSASAAALAEKYSAVKREVRCQHPGRS